MRAIASIAAVGVLSLLQGCTQGRTVLYNFADLDDHRIFPNRVVARAGTASPLQALAGVPGFVPVAGPNGDRGWRYSEADVQTIAFVLEAAVGRCRTTSQRSCGSRIGMEADALWALDRAIRAATLRDQPEPPIPAGILPRYLPTF